MASDPRLIVPFVAGIYSRLWDCAAALLRIGAGLMVVPHGLAKIGMFWSGQWAANSAHGRPVMLAVIVGPYTAVEHAIGLAMDFTILFTETAGAVMLAVGLLTRPIAFLLFLSFLNGAYVNFFRQGYTAAELSFLWLLVFFYFAVRGGGPYSLDRVIGKEF